MKITTFNPLIVSTDPEPIIQLFEELGFERHHTKKQIGDHKVTDVRMKDPNGFYVDVAQGDGNWTIIRINVDNFDEGYNFFVGKGFTEVEGFGIRTTDSSKYAILASPTGVLVDVIEHIKK
jgi:hypothetical protein